MTLDSFIRWLGTQKGEFSFSRGSFCKRKVRHKTLRDRNGTRSCPLNSHPKVRKFGSVGNYQIEEMGRRLQIYDPLAIARASDESFPCHLRKRMLRALGLEEKS